MSVDPQQGLGTKSWRNFPPMVGPPGSFVRRPAMRAQRPVVIPPPAGHVQSRREKRACAIQREGCCGSLVGPCGHARHAWHARHARWLQVGRWRAVACERADARKVLASTLTCCAWMLEAQGYPTACMLFCGTWCRGDAAGPVQPISSPVRIVCAACVPVCASRRRRPGRPTRKCSGP